MAETVTDQEIIELFSLLGMDLDDRKVATIRRLGKLIAEGARARRNTTRVTVQVDGKPVSCTVEPGDEPPCKSKR